MLRTLEDVINCLNVNAKPEIVETTKFKVMSGNIRLTEPKVNPSNDEGAASVSVKKGVWFGQALSVFNRSVFDGHCKAWLDVLNNSIQLKENVEDVLKETAGINNNDTVKAICLKYGFDNLVNILGENLAGISQTESFESLLYSLSPRKDAEIFINWTKDYNYCREIVCSMVIHQAYTNADVFKNMTIEKLMDLPEMDWEISSNKHRVGYFDSEIYQSVFKDSEFKDDCEGAVASKPYFKAPPIGKMVSYPINIPEGKISAGSVDSFGYLTKTDYKKTSHKPRMLKNEQGEIIAIAFVFSKENSEQ